MKVRATKRGYYGGMIREPGDVFEVADGLAFSKEWMERVDEPAPPADKPAKPAKGAKPVVPDPDALDI